MEKSSYFFDFDKKYQALKRCPLNEEFPLNIEDYVTVEEQS